MANIRKFRCHRGYRACPHSGGWSCRRTCLTCHGKGKIICPDCGGQGCSR
jgi:DnaJ-class molecular chaperone